MRMRRANEDTSQLRLKWARMAMWNAFDDVSKLIPLFTLLLSMLNMHSFIWHFAFCICHFAFLTSRKTSVLKLDSICRAILNAAHKVFELHTLMDNYKFIDEVNKNCSHAKRRQRPHRLAHTAQGCSNKRNCFFFFFGDFAFCCYSSSSSFMVSSAIIYPPS